MLILILRIIGGAIRIRTKTISAAAIRITVVKKSPPGSPSIGSVGSSPSSAEAAGTDVVSKGVVSDTGEVVISSVFVEVSSAEVSAG